MRRPSTTKECVVRVGGVGKKSGCTSPFTMPERFKEESDQYEQYHHRKGWFLSRVEKWDLYRVNTSETHKQVGKIMIPAQMSELKSVQPHPPAPRHLAFLLRHFPKLPDRCE